MLMTIPQSKIRINRYFYYFALNLRLRNIYRKNLVIQETKTNIKYGRKLTTTQDAVKDVNVGDSGRLREIGRIIARTFWTTKELKPDTISRYCVTSFLKKV